MILPVSEGYTFPCLALIEVRLLAVAVFLRLPTVDYCQSLYNEYSNNIHLCNSSYYFPKVYHITSHQAISAVCMCHYRPLAISLVLNLSQFFALSTCLHLTILFIYLLTRIFNGFAI